MKLKKLKMPPREEMDMSELEFSKEESPEYEAEEAMEGEEKEEAPEAMSELESVSDEDLLAEVKKRGLLSQLESETSEESAEDAYV